MKTKRRLILICVLIFVAITVFCACSKDTVKPQMSHTFLTQSDNNNAEGNDDNTLGIIISDKNKGQEGAKKNSQESEAPKKEDKKSGAAEEKNTNEREEKVTQPTPKGEVTVFDKGEEYRGDDNKTDNDKSYCSLIITCETVLNNMNKLDAQKHKLIPQNGIILSKKNIEFNEGESAFNILRRETKREKIHMEFEETPGLNSVYIEGINNLYEFDCGNESGWSYVINDKGIDVGCSEYMVKDGDVIKFYYVCSWDDFVF